MSGPQEEKQSKLKDVEFISQKQVQKAKKPGMSENISNLNKHWGEWVLAVVVFKATIRARRKAKEVIDLLGADGVMLQLQRQEKWLLASPCCFYRLHLARSSKWKRQFWKK